jgi:hypothetical protein
LFSHSENPAARAARTLSASSRGCLQRNREKATGKGPGEKIKIEEQLGNAT